jgi:uncharacterized lipoprotein
MRGVLIVLTLLILSACDTKEQVKYVAQSTYNDLAKKYKKLELKNRLLTKQNRQLNNENEILKHNLEKYKNGFKSMYE